jgi:hypothetical protein
MIYAITTFSACTLLNGTHHSKSSHISSQGFSNMTTSPTNPEQLLSNIKAALASHSLLKDEFYQDNHLKSFSGGERISRTQYSTSTAIEVFDFKNLFQPATANLNVPYFGASFGVNANSKRFGSIFVDPHADNRLTYELVTQLFGEGKVVVPANMQAADSSESTSKPHALIFRGETTHPYGNKDIVIHSEDTVSRTTILIEISGNGLVQMFTAEQESK